MKYRFRYAIPSFKLFNLYREIMPIKALCRESFNIITGRPTSFPVTINLLITNKCNFFCTMCTWKSSTQHSHVASEALLTLDDIKRLILQVKDYKPLLHIGGGEPFMHQDILEMISIIKMNKLKCLVTTNGFLVNEALAEKLLKLKVDLLIFSLYGWGSLHDQITNVDGSFDKIIGNLKNILKKRTKSTQIYVSIVPLAENMHTLETLINNLRVLGVDKVKIELVNYISSQECSLSSSSCNGFDLLPSTFIRENHFSREFAHDLLQTLERLNKKYRGFIIVKPNISNSQLIDWHAATPLRKAKCSFINHSVFVNYNGDVIPCQFFLRSVVENIKKESLQSIWSSKQYGELRSAIAQAKPSVCMRCCKT